MKIPELRNNEMIQNWLNSISSTATAEAYLLGMQHFTEFIKKAPEELISEAENEITLLMRKRHIKTYFINFKKDLSEKNLAPLTVKTYITAVKAFYRFYDIELPNLPKNKSVTLQTNNSIPSKKDLLEVLSVCDPLEKAILLTGASSGLAANELIKLKIKDFKEGYDPKTKITTLKLRRFKTDIDFITFLTPEASCAVLDYLAYRERDVKTNEQKRQKQLDKQKITSVENYLFCIRQIQDSYLTDKNDELRKFTHDGLMELYRRLSEKARKNTPKGNYNIVRSHNIRKFFNSTLLNAGCDFFHCEEFMGHHLPATQSHYFRADPEGLREYFIKFIPYLTIQREISLIESQEFKNVVNERDRYKAIAEKYFTDGLELINTKYELEKLKSQLRTPEEKKAHLIEWVRNKVPEDEAEAQWLQELKHVLNLLA